MRPTIDKLRAAGCEIISQSFDFLVAVSEFKHSVYASPAVDHDREQGVVGKDYDGFLAIVREYVESGARSEVRSVDRERDRERQG